MSSSKGYEFWLSIAKAMTEQSRCLKMQVGAVLVKNNESIGFGYNDANPREDYCPRADLPSGTCYFYCSTHCSQTHHAETMAISRRHYTDCSGAIMYIWGHNLICDDCRQAMKEYGIHCVVMKRDDDSLETVELL